MTMPMRHKKLEWLDFDWFSHKKEIFLDNLTIRCRSSNKKSQKILFFFGDLKHVTLDLSKKMFDVHMTSDISGRPHQNIMAIPLRRINRKIRRDRQVLSKYVQFIPFSNNCFKHFVLVDPYSNKFLKNCISLSELGHLQPPKLLKLMVKHEDAIRHNKKHYLVYALSGRRQGVVEVETRKHGFKFCSEIPIQNISNELYNKEHLKNKLEEVLGLKYNPKHEKIWKKWEYFIPMIEKIFRIKSLIN